MDPDEIWWTGLVFDKEETTRFSSEDPDEYFFLILGDSSPLRDDAKNDIYRDISKSCG